MYDPKCPGSERTGPVVPEMFQCPQCGGEIEIFTDEKKSKCSGCGRVFDKDADVKK